MTRPVYGLTVLRYDDGTTDVIRGAEGVYAPTDWQFRHAMLVDAAAEVKREAVQLPGVRCAGLISRDAAIELLNAECSDVTPAQRAAFVDVLFRGPEAEPLENLEELAGREGGE